MGALSMEGIANLNHPVVVLAILALVAIIVDKAVYMRKMKNGNNPIEKAIDRQTGMFERCFLRQDVLLDKLNDKTNNTHNLLERVHDKLENLSP